MVQVPNHGNRRRQKEGLTLLETVISLAIIVLVSIGTATLVISSSNYLSSSREKRFFEHELDSISLMYRDKTDAEEFEQDVHLYLLENSVDLASDSSTYVTDVVTVYYDALFGYLRGSGAAESAFYYLNMSFTNKSAETEYTLSMRVFKVASSGDVLVTERSVER